MSLDAGAVHALGSLVASVSASDEESGSTRVLIGPAFPSPDSTRRFFSGRERSLELVAFPSRKAVRDMDELRFKNRDHDVYVIVEVRGTVIMIEAQTGVDSNQPARPTMVFLKSTGSPVEQDFDFRRAVRIPSSDWLSMFLPAFGYDKTLLVELPISIEELKRTVRRIESQALGKRLIEAANVLERSQQLQRRGEWRESVWATREALELILRGSLENGLSVEAAVKATIASSGLPDDVGEAVKSTISQLHSFANSAHPVAKGGKEVKIAVFESEDAQVIFGSTVLVVNLIARKLTKLARAQ
jgi:hypothetical protein